MRLTLPANLAVTTARMSSGGAPRRLAAQHLTRATLAAMVAMLIVSAPSSFADDTADTAGAVATARVLDPPLPVRVTLNDGVTITGTVHEWDDEGIVGSFGQRRWSDLLPLDTWRLFRRLMDRDDPDAWIALGHALLLSRGGAVLAEAAFRNALRLDAEAAERVALARARATETIRQRETPPDEGIAADRLRLEPPEWRPWPASPWPVLDSTALVAANREVRDEVERLLSLLGLSMEMVRTDSLMLFEDGDRMEMARRAVRLESTRVRLAELLGVDPVELAPHGRIPIIVVDDREDFRALQQRVFLQKDMPGVDAMAHFLGPKGFVVAHRGIGGPELEHALAWQLVHAFMHRYISPRRLPPWANEGIAASVAAQVVPELTTPRARRRQALGQLRGGFNPIPVFDAAYGDAAWPGPGALGPDLGRLLVELLSADQPGAFSGWVVDVKNDESWGAALGTRFRMPPNRIIQIFIRHHQVRD